MTKRTYGWRPDVPDIRDKKFSVARREVLPPEIHLEMLCPPVYDQQSLGSCTSNAIAAAIDYDRLTQGKPLITPSRLFIYYNERVMEGTRLSDSGARIRDGIKTVVDSGACPESMWPYTISKFTIRPTIGCYKSALTFQTLKYQRLNNEVLYDLKYVLAKGHPFVFGFSVYSSFESDRVAKTGKVPMPKPTESMLGGHAVLAVGYLEKERRFIVRNSWGTSWGNKGYFTIPYSYLTNLNLADDFWAITEVE